MEMKQFEALHVYVWVFMLFVTFFPLDDVVLAEHAKESIHTKKSKPLFPCNLNKSAHIIMSQ